MAITPIDRTLRLLTLLAARLLTPLFPPLPSRLTLQRSGRQTGVGLDGPVAVSRPPPALPPPSPPLPPRLTLQRSGRQTVVGLDGPVAISRDRLGIPTIHARAASDLFFGFGYAMAQDRLWQMDLYRRLARGQLAEILGDRPLGVRPGARLQPASVVQLDSLHRALGFVRVAHASYGIISPEARSVLERYAAGVNAVVALMQEARCLPPEFYLLGYEPEPWRPQDSLAGGVRHTTGSLPPLADDPGGGAGNRGGGRLFGWRYRRQQQLGGRARPDTE